MVSKKEHLDAFRSIVGKAWADPAFMVELRNDPKRVLGAAGVLEQNIVNDPGRNVKIVDRHEDAVDQLHVFIPPRPSLGGDMAEEQVAIAFERLSMGPATMSNGVTSCCCDISVAPRLFE